MDGGGGIVLLDLFRDSTEHFVVRWIKDYWIVGFHLSIVDKRFTMANVFLSEKLTST